MQKHNPCPIFGQENIKITKTLEIEIFATIEKLVTEQEVYLFCFFGASRFEFLCLKILNDLKEKFPYIQSIVYPTVSSVKDNCDKILWKSFFDKVENKHPNLYDFDYLINIPQKKKYHKVFRDDCIAAIIDSCDNCIFCYPLNTLKFKNNQTKNKIANIEYFFAYNYACKTKKNIIEIVGK